MTPTERNACVKVYLGHHRTVVLCNWTVATDNRGRQMVAGTSVSSGQKEFFRVKGMRLQPLAAACDGDLVPLQKACRCNTAMAKAVENGYAWKPKVVVTNPKPIVSQPVNRLAISSWHCGRSGWRDDPPNPQD